MFYKKIKKISKNVVVVATIAATIVAANWTGSNVAKAADNVVKSDTWNLTKLPGYTTTPSATCTLTKYGGTIKFYTYTLGGDSYVVGKCKGINCTIDNANKYVKRSVASKTNYTPFKIQGSDERDMKFKVSLLHNGNINTTVYGSGKICY